MSYLRNLMIEQMQLKGYSSRTISVYIECISNLSCYFGKSPDLLTTDDIRKYYHYQITGKKVSRVWINQSISALKILLCQVLKRPWDDLDIPRPRKETRLPQILSRDEVREILLAPSSLKHRAILTITYSY